MKIPLVLSVGAAGPSAGLVVPELLHRGARVRALVEHETESDAALKRGATEIAIADLNDQSAMTAALTGVDAVFYIAPAFSDGEADMGQRIVSLATAVGVKRFIFSAVIHPILSALVNHRDKGPVEEAIISSGMEYTLLQPARFMQDYSRSLTLIRKGRLTEPYSVQRRMSWVDYRDVAEVAAIALTEDRLLYGTFELCAPGIFNREEAASVASEAFGLPIRAEAPSFDDWISELGLKLTETQLIGRRRMFEWYNQHSLLGNALTLTAILGRTPRTLNAFFQDLVKRGEK
jgi:uncharacterized protein YbjT (DUF2867 family)